MNEETNNNEKKRTTRITNRQYPLCVHIYQGFCYCQTKEKHETILSIEDLQKKS